MQPECESAQRARFGFIDASKSTVVEAVSVEAIGASRKFAEPSLATVENGRPEAARRSRFYSGGAWHEASVFTRDPLKPGHRMAGPAILIQPHPTLVVEAGLEGRITEKDHPTRPRTLALPRSRASRT